MKGLLFLLTAVISLNSCVKSMCSDQDSCENLKTNLISDNKNEVKIAIEHFIAAMDSPKYTEQNISYLVSLINSNCPINVKVDCFNCIKTLPTATEIYLTVSNSGMSVTKTVDLSYDNSNKIVFRNMHE